MSWHIVNNVKYTNFVIILRLAILQRLFKLPVCLYKFWTENAAATRRYVDDDDDDDEDDDDDDDDADDDDDDDGGVNVLAWRYGANGDVYIAC